MTEIDQILKFLKLKMADGRDVGNYRKCYNSPTDGPIGTKLGWSHPMNTSTANLFVTANGTGNVLVLGGVEIKNIHNFDETRMTLCHSGRRK